MNTHAESTLETPLIPRTLTKAAIRRYFRLTRHRYGLLIPSDLRKKMGILSTEQDRRTIEYNIYQTRILIEELQLTEEELMAIGELQ